MWSGHFHHPPDEEPEGDQRSGNGAAAPVRSHNYLT
jgi:hypothetical protein